MLKICRTPGPTASLSDSGFPAAIYDQTRKTAAPYHYIPTKGQPVWAPQRQIPTHHRDKVLSHLQLKLEQGVIKYSNSLWIAPAVFIQKKSTDINFVCV